MFDLQNLRDHPVLLIVLSAIWAWVSSTLILRMWLVHRRASFMKKFFWSLILLVPFFGGMFYAGLFQVPGPHGIAAPETPAAL